MSYYQKHIFFCTNVKEPGRKCCSQGNAQEMVHFVKDKLKELDLFGPGKIRVSASGCLGRCKAGPAMVIYPEGKWFTYNSEADVEAIITEYVINGRSISQLEIYPSNF